MADFAREVLDMGSYKTIAKSRYVNDKQITDHYAIVPTGQGLGALKSVNRTAFSVYTVIARRFLSIFYPAAEYQKISLVLEKEKEKFFAGFRVLTAEGLSESSWKAFGKRKGWRKCREAGRRISGGVKEPEKRYAAAGQ